MTLYRYSYTVDYFLPGAFARIVKTVPLRGRIENCAPQRLKSEAPEGCFGFSVIKTEIHTTMRDSIPQSTVSRRLIRTYYIDAELLDQEGVLRHCGRDSKAYRGIMCGDYDHMIRLFDGEILPFNPINTDILTN